MRDSGRSAGRNKGRFIRQLLCVLVLAFWVFGAPSTSHPQEAVPSEPRQFSIPAQPLTEALIQFGRQAGLQASTDPGLVKDLQSAPVDGVMTWQQALSTLLSGTRLSYRRTGTLITVERAPVDGGGGPARLDPITVDAVLPGTLTNSYNAPDNFAATRTDTPVIDTPQSTQAITRQALEDAGITEVVDSYDYLAGISRENNIGGLAGDAYLARGFNTENLLLNGNRTGSPTTLDTAGVERVEAVRGPTAVLFGRGDPGGLVNVVTKQPLAEPFHQVDVAGGTGFFGDGGRYRDARVSLDSGGPIDEEGRVRYRLNTAAEYEKSFRDDIDQKVFFISPVVDINPDSKTVANLELSYQYREFVYDRGVPFIDGRPQLPRDWAVGEGQTPSLKSNFVSGTVRVDRELTDAVTARLGIYTSYNDIDGDYIQISTVSGAIATAQRSNTDLYVFSLTAQPELVAEFATGSIGHTVLTGVDASYQKSKFTAGTGVVGAPFDVFDPDFPISAPAFDFSQPGNSTFKQDTSGKSIGLYIQDQVDLTDQLKVLAGIRWDAVWLDGTVRGEVNTGGPPFIFGSEEEFHDNALLPRLGIVYQPVEQIGVYASYSETYRPPTRDLTDVDGNQIDPEEGRSYEVGVKLEALDGKLGGTLAIFRADKDNVIQGDPLNPGSVTNIGKVRSQGVEFDLTGEVVDNLSVGVTYAFTDARTRGNANPDLPDGTRLRNVPRHAASLQAAYRFAEGTLRGFRVFGGIVYEGRKQVGTSATDNTQIPSYVRFDLGASYEVTDSVQARLLLQNLTDEAYYTSANGDRYVAVGQPFNATLGLRMRF